MHIITKENILKKHLKILKSSYLYNDAVAHATWKQIHTAATCMY